jgi:DNA-binding protein H-NS
MNKRLTAVFSIPLAASLLLATPAICFSDTSGETLIEKEKLIEMINRQSKQLDEQQKAMQEQEKRFLDYQQSMKKKFINQQESIDKLKSLVGSPSLTKDTAELVAPRSAKPTTGPSSSSTTHTSGPVQPVGKPPETSEEKRLPEVAAIFDQPGVLTPKGSLVIEPSLQYSHSSDNRISLVGYTIIPAITIGLIDVRRISRDTFVASLAARYGLTSRIELEGTVPYVYRTEEASTAPFATDDDPTDSSADGNGLGDIAFGIRYQMNRPTTGPFYIANLRLKSTTGTDPFEVTVDDQGTQTESPTGSGFWGLQPSLTVIFPSDPAVFFGSINYMWNIERNVGVVNGQGYGDIDPGDSYGFNFGMGLALNEKASFSLGYDHCIITRNQINGEEIPGELTIHVGNLMLGYSYRYSDNRTISFSLGAGVTDEAPDMQLTVRAPFNIL